MDGMAVSVSGSASCTIAEWLAALNIYIRIKKIKKILKKTTKNKKRKQTKSKQQRYIKGSVHVATSED